MKQNEVMIYTDGSCEPNPGIGGWSFVEKIGPDKHGHYNSGGPVLGTTNNRMEYQAAIEAIKFYGPQKRSIKIYTDSELLVKTCSIWLWKWKEKGWKRKKKKGEIKNLDLVKELCSLMETYKVEFNWIKGHNGDYHNELADELANEAALREV